MTVYCFGIPLKPSAFRGVLTTGQFYVTFLAWLEKNSPGVAGLSVKNCLGRSTRMLAPY